MIVREDDQMGSNQYNDDRGDTIERRGASQLDESEYEEYS